MTSIAAIVPLFDKRAYVAACIASLAQQARPPEELIVVDDASTDGSAGVAEQALARHADRLRGSRVALLRLPRNGGPGAARNAGIARSTAELVLCLDADDSLHADALRIIRDAVIRHSLAMAVLGYASDPPGESFPDRDALAGELRPVGGDVFLCDDPLRAAAHPDFIMGRASNVAVRRARLGGHRYRTDVRLNEGVDLWYRVLKDVVSHQERMGVIAAPLIRFRILADSLSHRRCTDWRMLDVPPTIGDCRDSPEPGDRRMSRMLADRWLAHAKASLSAAQWAAFVAHHAALLQQLEEPVRRPMADHAP